MIHHGDCLDILPTLDANSVDAVVTDPPYGLSFMGKDWDHGIPGVEFWKAAMRVMKPGAFLLAFGGTRTFHRLTCAIEDAGLEIRDCMMWLYGSGFPKSHDVSKAIGKAAGAEREVTGIDERFRNQKVAIGGNGKYQGVSENRREVTSPATDAARQWAGWGTALKPAWEPIIVARKPLEGTVAENVLKWGTGGMNIDGGRIGTESIKTQAKDGMYGAGSTEKMREQGFRPYRIDNRECPESTHQGRWPANVILDEEAGAMLDGQSGESKSTPSARHNNPSPNVVMSGANLGHVSFGHNDSGGASRFFYCAKASKRERNAGLEGMPKQSAGAYGEFAGDGRGRQTEHQPAANNHPTVKPISLLTYLAKLVCPPGGVILDPFMGSGSMAVAAQNLGFRFVGIEKEEQYCEIAKGRLGLVAA